MKIVKFSQKNLGIIVKKALMALRRGEVLACPTDTVYGLLCDSTNRQAVEKIFKIKKRDKLKPLAVFVKDIKAAKKLAFVDKGQEKFLRNNKITAILKAKQKILSPLVYKNDTIGIRIPDYKLLNSILKKFKNPLAQTSANISGNPPTTKIKEVLKQFAKQKTRPNLAIDAGDLPKSKPSKIVDLTGQKSRVLRR